MQIAMVGLGRMGGNIVRRLCAGGHDVISYDVNPEAAEMLRSVGARPISSLSELSTAFTGRRVVWIMVPAQVTTETIHSVAEYLCDGDVILDGGNSHFKQDVVNAAYLVEDGIHFIDIGTSGGVHGLKRGYCLMIGGDAEIVNSLTPIFDTLAPGFDAAERTPSRNGPLSSEERGWFYCGPTGAGHFVKMVHNGIEYGMMQAFAEGLNLLQAYPQYSFDLAGITEVLRRSSVVSSWLLDLLANGLAEDPTLSEFSGHVPDSGEGRWTVDAAVESGVPVPVLAASLWERFASRGNGKFGNKVLSALRKQFGGHTEK